MNPLKDIYVETSPEVYPPGEDTWFLAEIIDQSISDKNLQLASVNHKELTICEIGVGTGYISIFLAMKYPQITFIGTDISPIATLLSLKNTHKIIPDRQLNFFCTNLLNCFNASTLTIDIIYFNPPYVRTPIEEFRAPSSPIVKAWSGGPTGIEAIGEFLTEIQNFRFFEAFFLSSSLNENEKIISEYKSLLDIQEVNRKQIEDEKLICYKVRKN